MVRYFIDILDGDHAFRDDIGSDFADLESAQSRGNTSASRSSQL